MYQINVWNHKLPKESKIVCLSESAHVSHILLIKYQ